MLKIKKESCKGSYLEAEQLNFVYTNAGHSLFSKKSKLMKN